MMPLELNLFELVLTLAGFGALISLIVNVLKALKVIKDGQAKTWITGLNLSLAVALYVSGLLGYDLAALDGLVGQIAEIGVMILGLVVQIASGGLYHNAVRGVPVIGKSYSYDEEE